MKDYKIGYIKLYDNNKCITPNDQYLQFINYINDINIKYDLKLNIIIVDNYTKEECNLVLYDPMSGYENAYNVYLHIKNKDFFKNAKGNPKFLLCFWGEYHTYPLWYTDEECIDMDDHLIRTIQEYVPFKSEYKCYSITMYENTKHNCCMPYCINCYYINDIIEKQKNILNNKITKKNKFCSMICSHGSRERELIYNELNKYKKIDCFGNYHKNVENKYYDDNELNNLMPSYKFNICFENTHSDFNEFYVTEKICNAFQWGVIPIYWGNNKQIYEIFNKDSFINLTDIPYNKWIDIIKEYDNDNELYNKMLNQNPLLNNVNIIINKYFENKEKFIVNLLINE